MSSAKPAKTAVGPELIFAIVRPVGTPREAFHNAIDQALHGYGYDITDIKLSDILAEQAEDAGKPIDAVHEDKRINALMDAGDEVCKLVGSEAAVALHGVAEIRARRREIQEHAGSTKDANEAVPRRAWLVDSLKRPAEVTQLRAIYGDHLLTIGLQASAKTRQDALMKKLRTQYSSLDPNELSALANELMERDLREPGEHGQNMLKTFPLCDVFVDVDGDVAKQVERVLDLLFGSPAYKQPTPAEYGMYLAYVSSTRSPELGLKVGAALMADAEVVSLGVNTHPVVAGSPEIDSSAVDIRELLVSTVRQLPNGMLSETAQIDFDADPDKFASELLDGSLKGGNLASLIEFQPTVHAEMSALMDALRGARSISDTKIYVTAYPCHNCAKHLLALDIHVVYLEPYPKSRAASMYGEDVDQLCVPFTGVAPRRYHQLFGVGGDRKNSDGSRKAWTAAERRLAQPRVDNLLDQRGIADREAHGVGALDHNLSIETEEGGAG